MAAPRAPRGALVRRLPARPWWWRRRGAGRWWLLAAAALGVATLRLAELDAEARAARDAWGERRTVVVARADLDPGHVVVAGDTAVVEVPAALAPADALVAEPLGEVVTDAVAAGEVVLGRRVGAGGLSPVAARIPPGRRAVALARAPTVPPLQPGDVVDVIALRAVGGLATSGDGELVAAGAVVVDVGEDAVTVAVQATEAPAVSAAAAGGAVALVLAGA